MITKKPRNPRLFYLILINYQSVIISDLEGESNISEKLNL